MMKNLPPTFQSAFSIRLFSVVFLMLLPFAASSHGETGDMEHFFDGSLQGEPGEAAVDRNQGPEYYHFTLEGLSEFVSLQTLRVSVIPYESHSSRRLDMRVWSSLPTEADDEIPGFDFAFRDETALLFNYYDSDGELIEGEVEERDINQTGWVEVPLDGLSMEDVRTFRMSFDHGFRGTISIPYVEVTGVLEDGSEAVTLVRYDFDQEGSRALANEVHSSLQASIMWPQGFPLPEPIVSVDEPDGAYEAVQLQFSIPEGPGSFQDWVVFGGIRNDTMPIDHWVRVSEPGGYLVRDGSSFTGTFERQHRGEQPRTLSVEGTIDGSTISGTVTLTDSNPWTGTEESWTGTVTGTITPEAELRSENAINTEVSWPRFTGSTGSGNTAEVRGLSTINRLDDIRFQWGSEAIDIGQGIGSLNRHAFRYSSARKRSGGGSSSPVVADGKVYLYYSVPSPRRYHYFYRARNFTDGHSAFETAVVNMAEQGEERELFSGGPEELPVAVLEKIWEAADDVVICMDATTGQTLWRTRIENVGYNRQHHKAGPYNQTAAVHGDRIFAIGSGGWLHALDRNTGEALWHLQVGGEHSHQKQAVLAIEEAVIIPKDGRWAAFDPASGEQLWRNEEHPLNNISIPAFWRAADGTPVILVYESTSTGAALNAATGDTLFTFTLPAEEGFEEVRFSTGSARAGNPNNMTIHGNALVTHERFHHENSDDDRWAVAVYDLSLEGITPRWRYETEWIRGEWSPLVVQNRWVVTSPSPRGIMAFDIETGELMSEAGQDRVQEYTPGSNGQLMAMEDIIISHRDMTHGHIDITFFKIDGNGQLTNLNPDGFMPLASGVGTGSYHHPVMQAVVDGRLFMRERRGIMAYDLRMPSNLENAEVTEWPTASDLAFGQTLGDSTLTGGAANVAGTFAFISQSLVPEGGTNLYGVLFTPEDTETYATVLGQVEVTVEPVTATVSLDDMTQTYNGTPRTPTVTTGPEDFTYELTFDGESTAPVDAGTYTVVATITDPNAIGEATGTFTIDAAAITVKADDQSKSLGQEDPELTWTVTAGTLYGEDTLTGSLDREEGESAGSYAILQGTLTGGPNYDITFESGNLIISQGGEITIVLERPTVESVLIPEGVGLVLATEVVEEGGESGLLELLWSQESGDGTVTWEATDTADSMAWFSGQGTYMLRLTAENDGHTEMIEIEVEVVDPDLISEGDVNLSAELPKGWAVESINEPDPPGEVSWDEDGALLEGPRGGIWGTADTFLYVYTTISGDVDFKTRVISLAGIDGEPYEWAKSGAMIRETATPESKMGVSTILGDARASFYYRLETAGETDRPSGTPDIAEGYWLRIQRSGNEITSSYSPDGENWTSYPSQTIEMDAEVTVGLASDSSTESGSGIVKILFDDIYLNGDRVTVVANIGPLVNAGSGETVAASEEVILSGMVEDDGLPLEPGMVTTEWVQRSGPAVTLSDPTALGPTFTPTQAGEYIFRLIAFDGEVATANDIMVTVEGEDTATPFEDWLNYYDMEDRDPDDPADGVMKGGRMVTLREAFLLGEQPDDPNDFVRIVEMDSDAIEGTMRVHFPSLPNRFYTVEMSDDLQAESWSRYGEVAIEGNGEIRYFTVPMDTIEHQRRFFRVRVSSLE